MSDDNLHTVRVTRTVEDGYDTYLIDDDKAVTTIMIGIPHDTQPEDWRLLSGVIDKGFLRSMLHNLAILDLEREVNQ